MIPGLGSLSVSPSANSGANAGSSGMKVSFGGGTKSGGGIGTMAIIGFAIAAIIGLALILRSR